MTNKQQIKKLRDNAELAWASYGYFDLVEKKFDIKDERIKNSLRIDNLTITQTDILDLTYNKYIAVESNPHKPDDEIKVGKLKGDFTPTQTQRFFERYDILIHQPNTESGFSATLFQNKESKEYTLAIRGTEPSNIGDIKTDVNLTFKNLPKKQYFDMLLFYYQCIGTIPFYVESDSIPNDKDSLEYKLWKKLYQRSTESKYKPYIIASLLQDSTQNPTPSNFTPPITATTKLTITGHSLGGCLAQMFVLSFADYAKGDCGILNEVYTFNSPGARELNPLSYGILEISLPNLSSYDKASKKQYIRDFIKTLDINFVEARMQQERIPQNDIMWRLPHNLYYKLYSLAENAKEALHIYLSVDIEYEEKPAGDMEEREYYATLEQVDSSYALAYKTFIDNYYFHKEQKQGVDIGLPTYHIETDSDNNPNNLENKLIQNLGEDIEGKHYYLNIGIDVEGMERHSIKSSVVILYFYDYLLDLEANREKLSNHIKDLESNPLDSITLHYIGHKASKNKGKYQLITALFNDFMQWNYNSLKEVNKEVLKEVKKEYKERKKTNKDTPKPPQKIFPLVYLLSEVSYIARHKDSKKIQEFDMYKMIDSITQLQEAKLYVKILDKTFFDELENKQCSVAELRSVLKCQPFMVVDENNQEVLNESNRTELFCYKTFNNLVSQILQSYKTA